MVKILMMKRGRIANKKGGENRMKTGKERLDDRDKKRKEDKEHQLTLQINKLKLDTIKARSRSKTKYDEVEKEIDKLKDKYKDSHSGDPDS